jgi:Secretion system C-terminal sorting domain
MKQFLSLLAGLALTASAHAQITITSSNMPVSGDTLRYSVASPTSTTFSPADSGASMTWDYTLTPISQGVDTYQLAASVNLFYAVLGITDYGYKVADSLPGVGALLAGTTVNSIYTFFNNSSAEFKANGFGAMIDGIPAPFSYTTPDVWYFFPLTYGSSDSSHFQLNISIPSLGGIKEVGYRKTRVDGWGTIATPYYTTPVSCIRVRSEIHQIDSVSIDTLFTIGLPVNTVEYKWLVTGDHYPALWITTNLLPGSGTETVSSIRYRDSYRQLDTTSFNAVSVVNKDMTALTAYPVPAVDGRVTIGVPSSWQHYSICVYDVQSRMVLTPSASAKLDISSLPSGQYLAFVQSGDNKGYVRLVR